jgi:hypothetical protein
VTRGRAGRVQRCSIADARLRRTHASKFLEVAELVATEQEDNPESINVEASLAVLAGVAASDAACCAALGRRSRSHDHHDAERLLSEIASGGKTAAKQLKRLLDLKDDAQYGFLHVGGQDLQAVLRQAHALLEFAERILES